MKIVDDQIRKDCAIGMLVCEMAKKYDVSIRSIRIYIKTHSINYIMDKNRHRAYLSTKLKEKWTDPKFRERATNAAIETCKSKQYKDNVSLATKKAMDTPEIKAKLSRASKDKWNNPEYRNNLMALYSTEEYKNKLSSISMERWKDPGRRHKISVAIKKRWSDLGYRQKSSESSAIRQNTTSHKLKMSDISKDVWKNPNHRLKMRNIWISDEYKQKKSKIARGLWEDDEYRNKLAVAQRTNKKSLTKPHNKVITILDALNVQYEVEYVIGPWTFDVFIPTHNILIEVQGNYWHSFKDQIRRDNSKLSYISKYFPQYKLKYIWEHECFTDRQVESKLKYWLGITLQEVKEFNFNDLVIKTPNIKEADDFLYNWHYMYRGTHGIDYGGYINGQLIVLARFTSPHRKEVATSLGYSHKNVLELSRLCVHPQFQKKNLLSWFLSKIKNLINVKIKCLVSFADTTYGHTGAVYKASNWELHSMVRPDYYYVSPDGWVMHKKTLWNRASSLSMKELEYANKIGYIKVLGKEKLKFIYRFYRD